MKTISNSIFTLFLLSGIMLLIQCKSNKDPQFGKNSVKEVVAAMTLEEKAYFVTGTGMELPGLTENRSGRRSRTRSTQQAMWTGWCFTHLEEKPT